MSEDNSAEFRLDLDDHGELRSVSKVIAISCQVH